MDPQLLLVLNSVFLMSYGRRGEEHSFILKPVASMWKTTKSRGEKSYQSSHSDAGSSMFVPTNLSEGKLNTSTADQYAVLVSCRCNYTGIYMLCLVLFGDI